MKKSVVWFLWSLVLLAGLVACRQQGATPQAAVTVPPAGAEATVTATPLPPATSSPAPTPTLPPAAPMPTESLPPTWPPPATPAGPFAPAPITAAEQETFELLRAYRPPERDEVALAVAYKGVAVPEATRPGRTTPLPEGTHDTFNILNYDNNTIAPIEATLLAVSEHAYFWFDTDAASVQPGREELATVTTSFDQIYEIGIEAFGRENNPGIDGDPRVHIVHASPATLCEVATSCGLAGYFSSFDVLPESIHANSNEREMFVMNTDQFGTSYYLNVLAHEFRHMIEENYDSSDADWAVEGSAVLAEELAGFTVNAYARADAFLANPDQQLNSWTDGNTYAYYGQGYLLNRYIYDRLGPDLYREFATHPADGLDAVTAVAQANDLDLTGESLWLDWLAAASLPDGAGSDVPERYRLADGALDTVAMMEVGDLPQSFDVPVHQYAADYYRLTGTGTVTIDFAGSRRVPVLDVMPTSGVGMWSSGRANYSDVHLTRKVDLRGVDSATLTYDVYRDIEYGYDFAYVAVSGDGGQTWQGLVGEQMQGLDPADDPSENALLDRFYTGRADDWVRETIDLTPYAGQEIRIRFAYVTDPILTYGGLALDNISIPEIGFYDDAETTDEGWVATGFTRVTAQMPQQWHLQLVTFPAGAPTVTPLPLTTENTLSTTANLDGSGEAILIIAATAPLTLEQAHYTLALK